MNDSFFLETPVVSNLNQKKNERFIYFRIILIIPNSENYMNGSFFYQQSPLFEN